MIRKPGSVLAIIYLAVAGCPAQTLSDLPEGIKDGQPSHSLLAHPSYMVLHRIGFSSHACYQAVRWALTPPFHISLRIQISLRAGRSSLCGTFRPAVTSSPSLDKRYPVLWCPDFPPR